MKPLGIRLHSGAHVSSLAGVRGQRGACPALVNGRGSLAELNIKLMMTENRKMKFSLASFFRNLALGGVTNTENRTEMKQKKKGKCYASTSG
jgi:hypothetical protein